MLLFLCMLFTLCMTTYLLSIYGMPTNVFVIPFIFPPIKSHIYSCEFGGISCTPVPNLKYEHLRAPLSPSCAHLYASLCAHYRPVTPACVLRTLSPICDHLYADVCAPLSPSCSHLYAWSAPVSGAYQQRCAVVVTTPIGVGAPLQ